MLAKSIVKFCVILLLFHLSFTGNSQAKSSPVIVNEKLVIKALQTIHSAQVTYMNTAGAGNYGSWAQLLNDRFIDSVLATGEKYGYVFSLTVFPGAPNQVARFQVSAVPQRYGKSGVRSFYIDETGVVRGADRNGGPATVNDPLVQIPCGESGAVGAMRTIAGAQYTYEATLGLGNYGSLGQLSESGLIDAYLTSGEKCGYLFRVETTPRSTNIPPTFKAKAVPRQYQITGIRSFYIDENGILRGADKGGAEANADDPPIQN